MDFKIRPAYKKDAKEILDLYAPYVKNTAISFEYEVPTLEEFEKRIENIKKKYPYIVATVDDKIVGYAYASRFKERKAYDYSVEVSIYTSPQYKKHGLGRKLYSKLEEDLKDIGIKNMYACIVVSGENESWYFHKHMGFKVVGRFHNCGYKFNKWYDMIYMEKNI